MTLGLHIKEHIMNVRLITCLTAVLAIAAGGGCSGMRNFLFGRGAACGNCPPGGMEMGGPIGEFGCVMEPDCGDELGCGREPVCGHEGRPGRRPLLGRHQGCGLFAGLGFCNGANGCGCGQGPATGYRSGYGGVVNDPYSYSGEVIGSEIMGDPMGGYPGAILPGTVYPGTVYPGTISSDNFDARGERVIGIDPQPIRPSN